MAKSGAICKNCFMPARDRRHRGYHINLKERGKPNPLLNGNNPYIKSSPHCREVREFLSETIRKAVRKGWSIGERTAATAKEPAEGHGARAARELPRAVRQRPRLIRYFVLASSSEWMPK